MPLILYISTEKKDICTIGKKDISWSQWIEAPEQEKEDPFENLIHLCYRSLPISTDTLQDREGIRNWLQQTQREIHISLLKWEIDVFFNQTAPYMGDPQGNQKYIETNLANLGVTFHAQISLNRYLRMNQQNFVVFQNQFSAWIRVYELDCNSSNASEWPYCLSGCDEELARFVREGKQDVFRKLYQQCKNVDNLQGSTLEASCELMEKIRTNSRLDGIWKALPKDYQDFLKSAVQNHKKIDVESPLYKKLLECKYINTPQENNKPVTFSLLFDLFIHDKIPRVNEPLKLSSIEKIRRWCNAVMLFIIVFLVVWGIGVLVAISGYIFSVITQFIVGGVVVMILLWMIRKGDTVPDTFEWWIKNQLPPKLARELIQFLRKLDSNR